MAIRQTLILLLSVIMIACGGGGGDTSGGGDDGLPPTRPTVELEINSNTYESDVSAYAFEDGTKGILLDQGKTDNSGRATLSIYYDSRPVLIEVSGGQFKETGTGGRIRITADQMLRAITFCDGVDFSANVGILTHLAAAKTMSDINNHSNFRDAIDAGYAYISEIYGVNVQSTNMIDISDSINASGTCTDAHRLAFIVAGMSLWTSDAADQNGAFSQEHYNSVLLAQALAADISDDGLLSGSEMFGTVAIDQSVFQTGFGSCISRVITSHLNATTLDGNDFIGIELVVVSPTEESQILGGSFDDRVMMVNRTMLSDQYNISNTGSNSINVRIDEVGDQNQLTHDYYEVVRQHTIRRHRDITYRGRTTLTHWPEEIQPCTAGSTWQCGFLGDWFDITFYQHWETGVWNRVDLPPTTVADLSHNSDVLPPDRHQNWEFFITENIGDVRNYTNDYEHYTGGPGSGAVPELWNPLGSHNLPKSEVLCDYVLAQDDEYTPEQQCWWAQTRSGVMIALNYTGPHYERADGSWALTPDQMQYLTTRLERQVTPQIQRNYVETFSTLRAPENVTTAEHTDNHPFGGVSVSAEDGNGNPIQATSGFYTVPANTQLVIKKTITTPNIQLHSSGDVTYTPTTFDTSLRWVIQKSIRLTIREQEGANSAGLKSLSSVELNNQATYVVER